MQEYIVLIIQDKRFLIPVIIPLEEGDDHASDAWLLHTEGGWGCSGGDAVVIGPGYRNVVVLAFRDIAEVCGSFVFRHACISGCSV